MELGGAASGSSVPSCKPFLREDFKMESAREVARLSRFSCSPDWLRVGTEAVTFVANGLTGRFTFGT